MTKKAPHIPLRQEIIIGPYGLPVEVTIDDETEDQYFCSFYDQFNNEMVFHRWYDKKHITFVNQENK